MYLSTTAVTRSSRCGDMPDEPEDTRASWLPAAPMATAATPSAIATTAVKRMEIFSLTTYDSPMCCGGQHGSECHASVSLERQLFRGLRGAAHWTLPAPEPAPLSELQAQFREIQNRGGRRSWIIPQNAQMRHRARGRISEQ